MKINESNQEGVAKNTRSKIGERIKAGRSVAMGTRSSANKQTPVKEGKYVVTGEVEAKNTISAVIEEDNEFTHLVLATEVTSDVGEPQSYQEAKKSVLGHLWVKSIKSEVNNFVNRNVWTPCKLEKVKKMEWKPIPVSGFIKSKMMQMGIKG